MSPNLKILELIEILKVLGIIRFDVDFCNEIGIPRQHFNMIKNHNRNFTAEQVGIMCKKFDVNANWIFGIEETPFRNSVKRVNKVEKVQIES